MKLLASLFFAALIMGQNCEPSPPPVSEYCYGNDYSIMNNVEFGYEADGITGGLAAILHGDPSDDMRSTVQVRFGRAYCSGVVLTPTTVLTAGHCGYGEDTAHTVNTYRRDTVTGSIVVDQTVPVAEHIVHPDYLEYVRDPTNYEARHADLMVLRLAVPLPDTVPAVAGFYDHIKWAKFCNGTVAQGLGRHEQSYLDLRETKYVITQVSEKLLTSRASALPPGEESGRICFGDSGGPLYADVGGVTYLAGITSTTMSSDCEAGGSHVRVSAFADWILGNMQ